MGIADLITASLDQKYGLQQQAQNTAAAEASARIAQMNAQTGVVGSTAASEAALRAAQAGLLNTQAQWLPADTQSQIGLRGAQAAGAYANAGVDNAQRGILGQTLEDMKDPRQRWLNSAIAATQYGRGVGMSEQTMQRVIPQFLGGAPAAAPAARPAPPPLAAPARARRPAPAAVPVATTALDSTRGMLQPGWSASSPMPATSSMRMYNFDETKGMR